MQNQTFDPIDYLKFCITQKSNELKTLKNQLAELEKQEYEKLLTKAKAEAKTAITMKAGTLQDIQDAKLILQHDHQDLPLFKYCENFGTLNKHGVWYRKIQLPHAKAYLELLAIPRQTEYETSCSLWCEGDFSIKDRNLGRAKGALPNTQKEQAAIHFQALIAEALANESS